MQPSKQPIIWRTLCETIENNLAGEIAKGNVQEIVASRWQELLKDTDLVPIDVHTPMWLWSRGKFSVEI